MAENNLKEFIGYWAIFGLLFVSLLSFAITFMYNNNPIGLGDDASSMFDDRYSSTRNSIQQIDGEADSLLNITAETDPEKSFLGSRDSVAVSYRQTGSAREYWQEIKIFMGWVFTGDAGKLIISLFTGLFGFFALYYITKWIRTGS